VVLSGGWAKHTSRFGDRPNLTLFSTAQRVGAQDSGDDPRTSKRLGRMRGLATIQPSLTLRFQTRAGT
jgi:hypothetical protein